MSTKKFYTGSAEETQTIAKEFAREVLQQKPTDKAVVLALSGDLGAGKTTFLQGFAEGLGVTDKILSPTFVVMKRFTIQDSGFKNFYHFDLYRLESKQEVLDLGFEEIVSDPKNIIAIEWPEKISSLLPITAVRLQFQHLEENKREITIDNRA